MAEPVLRYHGITPGVVAFSTTRHGGYSRGNYAEFNINQHCGDAPEDTDRNLSLLCRKLNIKPGRLVMPHQTHGTEVRQIAEEFFSLPQPARTSLLEGVDAVMTDVRETCIGVSTADCIPILLYDTDHRAACAVHAGWRGTVGRIARKAVAAMQAAYSTRPQSLRAVIGPGISADAFEVGDEVYAEFAQAGFDMERISRLTDNGTSTYGNATASSLSRLAFPLPQSASQAPAHTHTPTNISPRAASVRPPGGYSPG